MSLPKLVGDRLQAIQVVLTAQGKPLTAAAERHENVLSIGIQASSKNSGTAYVGASTGQIWEIVPSGMLVLDISRLSEVYVRGVPGDILNVLVARTTGEASRPTGA